MNFAAKLFGRLTPQEKLVKALGEEELPSFPAVVFQVLQALRNPNCSSDAIAEKLAFDPALSTKLLRLANSAALSRRHPVKHIGQAVSLLGRAEVESLVLASGVSQALPQKAFPGYEPKRFWLAAARRAATARGLAEKVHRQTRFESFTAAFLEDMAIPLLARSEERYAPILEAYRAGDASLMEMERETFGWDHAEIGRALSEQWSFPELLSDAIGKHHDMSAIAHMKAPAVVIVGELREMDDVPDPEPVVEAAHAHLGLSKDEAREVVERAWEVADDLAQSMTGG